MDRTFKIRKTARWYLITGITIKLVFLSSLSD
jgi:hypothetical protein